MILLVGVIVIAITMACVLFVIIIMLVVWSWRCDIANLF